ncbi:MAG: ParB/RepB/Spo0J family partition protein [Candidatus Saccharibacteria bacterium]|nr:ParB/RepB/Spo0J family partition protein [Rhodoferax sp.]
MTEFANIPLALITPSLTNPRKNFNPTKLAELAESIATSGVHQPVLLRLLPGNRVADTDRGVQYELVAGERRLRASQQAGVPTIPALIRPLTDAEVLEIQIVENLQRDDLTELEEAEGYEALMQHSSINADAVGAKIGKSRSYVYGRLKLLDLSFECKQAMREGQIDASRAILVARIPDATLQAKALQAATEPNYQGDVMSVRAFQTWLQNNVMLKLENAVFKITDTRLITSAGSCKECPKRTGANPDLFADVSSADICPDPVCFHAKETAHRIVLIARAEKKGMRFIEGKEAQELIPHQYTDRISGYTPLSQKREDIIVNGQTGLTMRALLGDDAPGAVLIENPYTHALVEAVPTDEAEAVLLAKGLLASTATSKGKPTDYVRELERLQTQITRRTRIEVGKATLQSVVQAIRATDDATSLQLLSKAVLRAWLTSQLDDWVSDEEMATALGYTFEDGEDENDGLITHINAIGSAELHRAVAAIMAMADERGGYGEEETLTINALVTQLAVPIKSLTKEATATVRAEFADQVAQLQAKINPVGKKPLSTPAPLAQPYLAPGKAKATPGSAAAAPRKAKTTPEEALSGIAAAMQIEDRAATAPPEVPASEAGTTPAADADPLYDQALALIAKEQKANVRLFKSHLGVGTTKAMQLMDILEQTKKVSACDERGARKVLVAA